MDIVVIGGGAAGMAAALEARRHDRKASITVLESGPYTQYSSCALPFVISRDIPTFENIELHPASFYKQFSNIDIYLDTAADRIDTISRTVHAGTDSFSYDALILATGSLPFIPPIRGLDKVEMGRRVFAFKTLETAKKVDAVSENITSAIVVGAGLVGLEVAMALRERGLEVTVVEALDTVMPQMIDPDMAKIVIAQLEQKGILLMLDTPVDMISESSRKVRVEIADSAIEADICIIACGVRANTSLAESAGIDVGKGVATDGNMRTSDSAVFACGDCAESLCAVSGNRVMSQLGSTAVRQAKVAGANAVGLNERFEPTFSTSITKIGDIEVAACGITSFQAKESFPELCSSRTKAYTLPEYYPGGTHIVIKLLFTPEMRIVGGQIIGKSGVFSRISMLSTAMQAGVSLDGLRRMETAYTPPVSPTIDPVTLAAEMAYKRCIKKKSK